jgi:hypothetical protein
VGSIYILSEIDLNMNNTDGAVNSAWHGIINSDQLNCDSRFPCSFTGYWHNAAEPIPEPAGLAVLGLGFAALAFLRRTRATPTRTVMLP